MVDGAAAAVFVKDREGRYRLVNRHLELLTGRPREALLGRRDDEVFSPEVAATLQAHDRQVWASDAGFDAHLLKPADLAEVYAAITRVQARRAGADA